MSHPERVKDYPKAEVKTLFSSTIGFCLLTREYEIHIYCGYAFFIL